MKGPVVMKEETLQRLVQMPPWAKRVSQVLLPRMSVRGRRALIVGFGGGVAVQAVYYPWLRLASKPLSPTLHVTVETVGVLTVVAWVLLMSDGRLRFLDAGMRADEYQARTRDRTQSRAYDYVRWGTLAIAMVAGTGLSDRRPSASTQTAEIWLVLVVFFVLPVLPKIFLAWNELDEERDAA